MESGFSALAQVAGTLFGIVLVSLVFAYSMAITRIDSIREFEHFASWVWSAGFSCFLYFSCCFLIAFRLMEDETWRPALIGIAGVITVLLIFSHYRELKWLRKMIEEDYENFKRLQIPQLLSLVFIFVFFEFMIWRALNQPSASSLESAMYTALTYTLFFASLRAVLLVGDSFVAIVVLHKCSTERTEIKEEPQHQLKGVFDSGKLGSEDDGSARI
ncbi:MAG TPA: hypothetical protein VFG29_14705 [Syntrophales bacterium]|nr:hypothetical protein [Syntrophales bacterium]